MSKKTESDKIAEALAAKREVDKLVFQDFPNAAKIRKWKFNFKETVQSGSGRPNEASDWVNEIDKAFWRARKPDSGLPTLCQ